MRDRQARRRSFTRTGLLILSAAAGGAFALSGVPSCADALHLDPPNTTTDAGNTTDASQQKEAGPGSCSSSADCSYPKGTCDLGSQTCVQCLSTGDCSEQPGTVCSEGACTCPPTDGATLSYCPGQNGGCVDMTSSPTNCGGCGFTCSGACIAGKCDGGWTQTTLVGAPEPRSHHVAVWTGTQMFVWGGQDGPGAFLNSGGLYDPVKQVWTPTSAVNAPDPSAGATAVWTGSKVIVWGGTGPNGPVNTGGVYDPVADTWVPMYGTASGVPSPRSGHTAVWNPTFAVPNSSDMGAMIVWGGNTALGTPTNTGGVFDPVMVSWVAAVGSNGSPPSPRAFHTAVWDSSGNRMVVFGGLGAAMGDAGPGALGDAFALDGVAMDWNPIMGGMGSPPAARYYHTALWDSKDNQTVIWGGFEGGTVYGADGAELSGTNWTPILAGAPEGREGHTAVFLVAPSGGTLTMGPQMIIFGGDQGGTTLFNDVWAYNLLGNSMWTGLDTAPSARTNHTAVVGQLSAAKGLTAMIVWGGDTANGPTNTGAVLDATLAAEPQ